MPSSTINNSKSLPFALSIGEPSGIGPEIILKSWAERSEQKLPDFFVVGSEQIMLKTAQKIGLDIPLQKITTPMQVSTIFQNALPVLDIERDADFEFGNPSTLTAALTIGAIEQSVKMVFDGKAAGLVTAPIQKAALYEAGFTSPGHTEFLAELCKKRTSAAEMPVMMLVADGLRVVPLTIHITITEVAKSISPDIIRWTCEKVNTALIEDFGIEKPRIAVAGLNPHAGEDGTIGNEEQLIIGPALDRLRDQGMNIMGPLPADTMFHGAARVKYDAALCMYHDQALIPIKTLDFEGGVNVTVGLPIVRTSPDHGTALDIAGQNLANPNSMINALRMAEQIYKNRMISHV